MACDPRRRRLAAEHRERKDDEPDPGQAKSHCVAWTIDDLLTPDDAQVTWLAERTYLLEDCSSPVVVPDVVDYTDEADAAFERFAAAGMHVVRSTDPLEQWPGLSERMAGLVR